MKKIYSLVIFLLVSTIAFTQTQMNLPVTFDDATVNYGVVGFEGAEQSSITAGPVVATNMAVKVIKTNTAQFYAGTTVTAVVGGVQTGFSSNIPFTAAERRMNVRVYSPHTNIQVRLKVEDKNDPTKSVETETTFTGAANTWQTLEFNFNNQATGTAAFNSAFNYNKATIFFNFGVTGAAAGERTYYFDDMKFGAASGGGGTTTLPLLPLDFESATIDYTFSDFGGGVVTKIANPQISGINTSANVGKMVKGAPEVYAGSFITLAGPIDFSVNKTFKVKVFSPRVGAKLLLKVENATNGGINFEKEATSTVANAWEDLTFDYSTINTANQYSKLIFIFDLGTAGNGSANYTWLFDDVRLTTAGGGGGGSLTQMNLPVTFDDPTVNYGLVGFEGAEQSTIVADPTLASNKVAKVIKTNTAQFYAGTTVTAVTGGLQTGFSSNIPFTTAERRMNVRVYSPHTNIQVRLKVEDKNEPTKSVETEATFTAAANTWQTLEFNFNNQATGTAAFNPAFNYNKATIFFNFGVTGATAGERTYYFDDVKFGAAPIIAPAAPVVTGTVTYCQNATAVPLTATATAGNTLVWYTVATGGTGSATAPTPSTTAAGSTNYYVSQRNPALVEGPRSLITVVVNATPSAPTVSAVIYCQGSVASPLSATAAAGNSLKFYTTATGGTGTIIAPTPGTAVAGSTIYYVNQTSASGCESPRVALTVTVDGSLVTPVITASPSTSLVPGTTTTVSITGTIASGTAITWFRNAVEIPGVTGNSVTVGIDDLGTYSAKVTNLNGCEKYSNSIVIGATTSEKMFVYPNPSTGLFQIRYLGENADLSPRKVSIFNSAGVLVYRGSFSVFSNSTPLRIDLSNRAAGIYQIRLSDNRGKVIATQSLILVR